MLHNIQLGQYRLSARLATRLPRVPAYAVYVDGKDGGPE